MKYLINILFWIWQLPQHLIGLAYQLMNLNQLAIIEDTAENVVFVKPKGKKGSVSLGKFVFLSNQAAYFNKNTTLKHEKGHSVQSKWLGPLYLLIIGIPSIMWAGLRRLGCFTNYDYYSFYTEKWADKLGGVIRK